ncbi:MAG: hypothetical protein HYR75_08405 [Gemmatimonadetes bacterium]|nr:hypothetical protein [Gemmatimonadota bacterium]MBI3567668.1 hypothetical protein [Gemmatimonadota bacterium]
MKRLLAFAALLGVVCLGGAALVVRLVPGAEAARAVWMSAWIAVVVQGVGFGFAWSLRKDHVMLGWGAGMMLRFVSLAIYALVVVRALGLSIAPALLSLAGFFFVTTLFEPILLKP